MKCTQASKTEIEFPTRVTGFHRLDNALLCDGVALTDLAAAEGTPLYVYSASTIVSRYRAIDDAFASYPHALHYALKANSTLAIARLLRGLGSRADANSGGEIDVALRAGFIPAEIVFTGVGKTSADLAQAIELGVMTINAESTGEIERIDALASARQTRARVALRVNPDIDAKSHPHHASEPYGDRLEPRELARRLDVDRLQAERDGALELLGRLADAGEHDLRGDEAGPERDVDLTA